MLEVIPFNQRSFCFAKTSLFLESCYPFSMCAISICWITKYKVISTYVWGDYEKQIVILNDNIREELNLR